MNTLKKSLQYYSEDLNASAAQYSLLVSNKNQFFNSSSPSIVSRNILRERLEAEKILKSPDDVKLKHAEEIRQIGNKFFSSLEFQKAIEQYSIALHVLNHIDLEDDIVVDKKDCIDKKVACLSNSALCYLKLKKFVESKACADRAVYYDKTNTKAIFRRGQASAGMSKWEEAEKDFREVVKLDSANSDAQRQVDLMVEKQEAEKERLKKNMAKMFG